MEVYDITSMDKPKVTRTNKWRECPGVLRYRAFCDEVCLQGVGSLESGSHVTFAIPIPTSWGKKKRVEFNGKPHQAKPDFNNMIKVLMDVIYEDDTHIWGSHVTKLWEEKGQIIVRRIAE